MKQPYDLSHPTSEIWTATCKACGKPFSSDVREKAIRKVLDHVHNCRKSDVR